MVRKQIPTLHDHGHDAIGEFVEDVSDDEREKILNELYMRQREVLEDMEIGESRYIQGGGARVYRESLKDFRIEFLSPTQELKRNLKRILDRIPST